MKGHPYSVVAWFCSTVRSKKKSGEKATTVVPAMGGHPWDQAKVSVHERWPLIRGTGLVGLRQTHYTVHNSIMQHHQRYSLVIFVTDLSHHLLVAASRRIYLRLFVVIDVCSLLVDCIPPSPPVSITSLIEDFFNLPLFSHSPSFPSLDSLCNLVALTITD